MANSEPKNYRKVGFFLGFLYFLISAVFVAAVIFVSITAVQTKSVTLTFMAAVIGIVYCILMFSLEYLRISKARKKELKNK